MSVARTLLLFTALFAVASAAGFFRLVNLVPSGPINVVLTTSGTKSNIAFTNVTEWFPIAVDTDTITTVTSNGATLNSAPIPITVQGYVTIALGYVGANAAFGVVSFSDNVTLPQDGTAYVRLAVFGGGQGGISLAVAGIERINGITAYGISNYTSVALASASSINLYVVGTNIAPTFPVDVSGLQGNSSYTLFFFTPQQGSPIVKTVFDRATTGPVVTPPPTGNSTNFLRIINTITTANLTLAFVNAGVQTAIYGTIGQYIPIPSGSDTIQSIRANGNLLPGSNIQINVTGYATYIVGYNAQGNLALTYLDNNAQLANNGSAYIRLTVLGGAQGNINLAIGGTSRTPTPVGVFEQTQYFAVTPGNPPSGTSLIQLYQAGAPIASQYAINFGTGLVAGEAYTIFFWAPSGTSGQPAPPPYTVLVNDRTSAANPPVTPAPGPSPATPTTGVATPSATTGVVRSTTGVATPAATSGVATGSATTGVRSTTGVATSVTPSPTPAPGPDDSAASFAAVSFVGAAILAVAAF